MSAVTIDSPIKIETGVYHNKITMIKDVDLIIMIKLVEHALITNKCYPLISIIV